MIGFGLLIESGIARFSPPMNTRRDCARVTCAESRSRSPCLASPLFPRPQSNFGLARFLKVVLVRILLIGAGSRKAFCLRNGDKGENQNNRNRTRCIVFTFEQLFSRNIKPNFASFSIVQRL
jgi:hypothetical protein